MSDDDVTFADLPAELQEACEESIARAILTAPGPYTARPARDDGEPTSLWYVTNDGRRNVLRFEGGAVFANKFVCEGVARRANERGKS